MLKWLKYLSLLMAGKDVAKAYREEQGKDKPAVISKRFIGAVVLLLALALAKFQGVEIDQVTIDTITHHLEAVGVGVYALILIFKGIYDRVKRQ